MLVTDATLYLPVSHEVLDSALDEGRSLEEVLSTLPTPQIAALMVVHCLHTFRGRTEPTPERMLLEFIARGNELVKRAGAAGFVSEALRMLDRKTLGAGAERLADRRIVLLEAQDLEHRSYLTAAREWDVGFTERHRSVLMRSLQAVELSGGIRRLLTPEQTRVYGVVRGQPDERLHVQGYAGTGKTCLVQALLMMLGEGSAQVILLAEHKLKLDAQVGGIARGRNIHPMTFDDLMNQVIPRDLTRPEYEGMRQRYRSRSLLTDDVLAQHLGIRAGERSPLTIARITYATVRGFCWSGDREILEKHIPGAFARTLKPQTRAEVVNHARALWQVILAPPSKEFVPPVKVYHRVKWAALNGWTIPKRFSHVVIDECHDLSKALLQILDHSPQTTISLGDEYQNLWGRPYRRWQGIRQREVTHSMRCGEEVEGLINPIIYGHPGQTKEPFCGNPYLKTEIVDYDKVAIPEAPAVIVVSDIWALFEWAQRLAQIGEFEFLSDRGDLDRFVQDLIELKAHGTPPRHGALFRYASWETLVREFHQKPVFDRIKTMLGNEYGAHNWEATRARMVTGGRASGYALGRVEDVRNREFDSVMLAPDLVERAFEGLNTDRAAAASANYVALTRGRRRLIVPRTMRGWIEEIGV